MNASEGDLGLGLGEDDENMVSSGKSIPNENYSLDSFSLNTKREKHLRYRTRVFAAEYVPLHSTLISSVIFCQYYQLLSQ